MVHEDLFMRQLDILPHDELRGITLVGCGGIGSTVAIYLAKMGFPKFTLYDADVVERHNLSNQMFPRDSVNRHKVEVVADEIFRMSPLRNVKVHPHWMRFEQDTPIDDNIVVSALDSMESRRDVWKSVVDSYTVDFYIDARMGGEVAKVYSVRPSIDAKFYEPTLRQGNHTVKCTAQAIAYNVSLIASIIGSNIRKFVTDLPIPRLVIGDALNLQMIHMGGTT